ncbi:MAG: DNA repair protein RecO [bacterium]
MFVHYRTQGLVVEKRERGEADLIFTIYTKDFGKLEILGRAVRKISSKLRSAVRVFCLSEMEFVQGKRYKTLTDAILIEKFGNIKKDLGRLAVAHKIADILDELISGQERDEKVWRLLKETFDILDNRRIVNWQIVFYFFFWNFISLLGYRPELYCCSFCKKKLEPERLFFSHKEGGVICQNCAKRAELKEEIDSEAVKILRIIIRKDWEMLSKLKIDKNSLKELQTISGRHYLYLCESLSSL